MKIFSVLTILSLIACFGCSSEEDTDTVLAGLSEQIPMQQEFLGSLGENGKFEVKIVEYDPLERIVHLSMPRPVLPDGSRSVLAHEFADGATLPYQFDGTNWIPLWSPSLPPEVEAELIEKSRQTKIMYYVNNS